MNEELKRDLGETVIDFTETTKQSISTGSLGQHNYFEFWLNAEAELMCRLQDDIVKHKDKHSLKELIFFSLIMGQAIERTMDDLRKLENEE